MEISKASGYAHSCKNSCHPLVGLIYLCAIGSVVWLDFLYGMAVALLIPNILVSLIA